jgi:tetratricopeptide (TPR) repeat protein
VSIRVWWTKIGLPQARARAQANQLALAQAQDAARVQAARDELSSHPKDPLRYEHLASMLESHGQVEESLALRRRATSVAAERLDSWQNLANAYLAQRRYVAAEDTFRSMARRWPRNGDVQQGLAVVYLHTGRLEEALAAARKAVQLGPSQPINHYVLGAVIEEIGMRAAFPAGLTAVLEEGRKHLLLARKAAPQYPDLDYRRGRICLLIRRSDEAKEALTASVRLTPTRAVAWLALSEALLRCGDVDGAIAAARKGASLGPMDPAGPLAVGKALLLKTDPGSLNQAATEFAAAAQLNPTNGECQERLGAALLRLNRLEEARDALLKAYQLDPNRPFAVQQLSQIYQRLKQPKLAEAAAKQAQVLSINERLLRQVERTSAAHPENPLLHLSLADRYREIGWLPQAADEYSAALRILPSNGRATAGLTATRKLIAQKGRQ